MTARTVIVALALVLPSLVGAQATIGLAGGRPATPGITRTTIKDDEKVAVARVTFAPGATEVPHTHPYDIMIIPVASGPVVLMIGDRKITFLKAGEVQIVPREVTHSLGNAGETPFEIIAVGIK